MTSPDRSTIIAGGDVVTMNGNRQVLLGGSVVVADGLIAAVGSTAELRAAHPDAAVIDATDCVVTPGMVNAHQHLTGDPLVRSCIPDLLTSGASIFQWAVPIHAVHSGDDDELSATLCAIECAQNGVTTVVEAGTVAHPDRVAAAMVAVGIRGTVGTWGWDIEEGPYVGTVADVLERQRAVVELYPAGGLVEGWVTLVGHDLASDELLAGAAELSRSLGTGMTMHLSPTSSDPESYLARTGHRPITHLHNLGVLGANLLLAHGVWLDDEEIDLVLSTRTAIAYCPWAYLRLGQGVTASAAMPRSSSAVAGLRLAATPPTPAMSPTSCVPPLSRQELRVTADWSPNDSVPIRRSRWPPSPVPKQLVWPIGSARWRSANRPTSSCTALPVGAGRRGAISGCNWSGALTAVRFAMCSSPGGR